MEKDHSAYRQTDSFLGRLSQTVHSITAQICLAVMTCTITLEVIGRYFFNSGFTWSQELCGLAFFLLVFLCQSNTWQEDRHIRMDIFYNNFSPLFRRISNFLTILCGSIFYTAIAFEGISGLEYQFHINEGTMELEWPLWPFTSLMILSCLLTLALLARFSLKKLFGKQS